MQKGAGEGPGKFCGSFKIGHFIFSHTEQLKVGAQKFSTPVRTEGLKGGVKYF